MGGDAIHGIGLFLINKLNFMCRVESAMFSRLLKVYS